jgi:predicted nucleotidyltransferase
MDRGEIIEALTDLAAELEQRGVSAEMYVVGGAAIALAFDERRATRDIDAVFEPKGVVYEAAASVGEERELPVGWLNDAVKGFLVGDDPAAAPVLDLPGLRCLTASPETLLALKVLAHRVGEDEDDLRLLARELGLKRADEILEIAERTYGDRLDPAARFFVEQVLGAEQLG